jgi:hypothetical protein
MTAHDVLVGTKGYLLNRGWKQGGYGRDGGPRCLVGAMASVSGLKAPSKTRARPVAMRKAQRILEETVGTCASWFNDDDERTFEEVINALDDAIVANAPIEQPERALVASS